MSWRMIGKPFATADVTAVPTISQRFLCQSANGNEILRGIVLGVVFYNNPAFTAVSAQLWSDRGGAVGSLIASSTNSYTKLECMESQNSAYKSLGFTFDDIALRAGAYYQIALVPSGYTGDATAHIAWRSTYPDPQYRTGLTLNAAKGANHPLEFSIISSAI